MSEPLCKCRQLQSTEIDTEAVAEFLAERAGKAIEHYGGQELRDMLGKLVVTGDGGFSIRHTGAE